MVKKQAGRKKRPEAMGEKCSRGQHLAIPSAAPKFPVNQKETTCPAWQHSGGNSEKACSVRHRAQSGAGMSQGNEGD